MQNVGRLFDPVWSWVPTQPCLKCFSLKQYILLALSLSLLSNWNVSMVDIHFQKLLWVYCVEYAGVKGNDRADRLAGKATRSSGSFSEDLKCWGTGDATCGHKAKDITPSIAWSRKAWKEEALDDLTWKDERGLSSIRRTLEPFQRQHLEIVWETGWSAYGLFRAHRYHLELNWTELKWTSSHHTHHSSCLVCLFTILTYVGK